MKVLTNVYGYLEFIGSLSANCLLMPVCIDMACNRYATDFC